MSPLGLLGKTMQVKVVRVEIKGPSIISVHMNAKSCFSRLLLYAGGRELYLAKQRKCQK